MYVFIFQISTLKMCSYRCFLKNLYVVSLSILLSSCFWGYVGIWLMTCSLVLVLSSAFIFTFLSQEKNAESSLDNKSIDKDVILSNELENKSILSESELHEDDHSDVAINGGIEKGNHVYQDVGDVSYSESESNDISFSSEDWSDGSISDEESLFEIEIPSGNCLASPKETQKSKQEEGKQFSNKLCNFDKCDPMFDFFDVEAKRMFKQQCIMDLLKELNEMNMEEENLIEIDIAMGSIKCPRYEIEA